MFESTSVINRSDPLHCSLLLMSMSCCWVASAAHGHKGCCCPPVHVSGVVVPCVSTVAAVVLPPAWAFLVLHTFAHNHVVRLVSLCLLTPLWQISKANAGSSLQKHAGSFSKCGLLGLVCQWPCLYVLFFILHLRACFGCSCSAQHVGSM